MMLLCDRCRSVLPPRGPWDDLLALAAALLVIAGVITVLSAMLRLIPR